MDEASQKEGRGTAPEAGNQAACTDSKGNNMCPVERINDPGQKKRPGPCPGFLAIATVFARAYSTDNGAGRIHAIFQHECWFTPVQEVTGEKPKVQSCIA